MNRKIAILAALASAVALTGCSETTGSNDGLSGTSSQFASMNGQCKTKASQMTGIPANQIAVTNQIQTGSGPLLTLDARGTSYSCRLESDGSVTVFSEFAN